MKNSLKIFSLATLFATTAFSTVACSNPFSRLKNSENDPKQPIIKDINYYQNLIKELEQYISDCKQMLQEIKDSKDDYDDEKDYQSALDEVAAEIYLSRAQINQYQASILFLTVRDLKFNPIQVIQGISIFTEAVSNLKNELALKEKYPNYYSEAELLVIKENITLANNLLQYFVNLKENENERFSF